MSTPQISKGNFNFPERLQRLKAISQARGTTIKSWWATHVTMKNVLIVVLLLAAGATAGFFLSQMKAKSDQEKKRT